MPDEPKHTPGPWWFTEYPAGGCGIGAPKFGVAYVFTSKDICPNDPDEAVANARLIAAAPETAAERDRLKAINAELLRTLEDLVRQAKKVRLLRGVTSEDIEIDQAQVAIAKAEREADE